MKPIHIFSPGTQTAMDGRSLTFSEADLAAAAAAYDPAVHEAPIVVGHPKTDAPAFGWVKGLAFADGKLTAQPDQINPDFAEMVENGAFKKVSASFYLPGAKNNPSPGNLTLRHVGFLGAKAPSVKGLDPVEFADAGDGVVEFSMSEVWSLKSIAATFRRLRDWLIETQGTEKADEIIPAYGLEDITDAAATLKAETQPSSPAFAEPTPTDQEIAMSGQDAKELDARAARIKADEDVLKKKQDDLAAQAASFAEAEARTRRKDNAAFLEGLIAAGKFAPGAKAQTLDFMDTLDPSDVVEFGEADTAEKKTPLDFFRDLLGKSGEIINFGEVSAAEDVDAGTASFAAPDGYTVDTAQLETHNKAVAYQAAHPDTAYIDAVRAVGGK